MRHSAWLAAPLLALLVLAAPFLVWTAGRAAAGGVAAIGPALLSTIVSVPLGVAGGLGMWRMPPRLRGAAIGLCLLAVLAPRTLTGHALAPWFASAAALLSAIVAAAPLVALLLLGVLLRLHPGLMRAAAASGAAPGQAFRFVLWPSMRQGVALAAGIAFIVSLLG